MRHVGHLLKSYASGYVATHVDKQERNMGTSCEKNSDCVSKNARIISFTSDFALDLLSQFSSGSVYMYIHLFKVTILSFIVSMKGMRVVMGHLGPAQGQCPGAQNGGCEFCDPQKRAQGQLPIFDFLT